MKIKNVKEKHEKKVETLIAELSNKKAKRDKSPETVKYRKAKKQLKRSQRRLAQLSGKKLERIKAKAKAED